MFVRDKFFQACLIKMDYIVSLCLAIYLSYGPSVCLSFYLFVFLPVICLSVCIYVCTFVSMKECRKAHMSIYSSIHVTACLPAFPCICMFVSVCVCLYLYLSPLELGSSLTQNYVTSPKKQARNKRSCLYCHSVSDR